MSQTVKELVAKLSSVTPTDAEFEAAFTTARVSKNYLARYYLRALELKQKGMAEPEWIPNDGVEINQVSVRLSLCRHDRCPFFGGQIVDAHLRGLPRAQCDE